MTNKIEFTEEANKQIIKITSEQGKDSFFRISVQGGGCSGFKYNFSFDKKIQIDDVVFDKTIIDKNSWGVITKLTLREEHQHTTYIGTSWLPSL